MARATDAQRINAYEASSSDRAAAALCGLTPEGFRRWRLRHELPAKGHLSVEEVDARLAAYYETDTPTEAAARVGITIWNFNAWRYQRGLPPQGA